MCILRLDALVGECLNLNHFWVACSHVTCLRSFRFLQYSTVQCTGTGERENTKYGPLLNRYYVRRTTSLVLGGRRAACLSFPFPRLLAAVRKTTEEFCQSNNGALLGKCKTRCIDMLQHVSEILARKRGDKAGLKWARAKTRPIPSMQRKRTCPACRKRVQCTLSLGVYRSPASGGISVSLCQPTSSGERS